MRKVFLSLLLVALVTGCSRAPEPAKTESSPPAARQARKAEPDPRPVIVAFGDSLTAGMGVDPALSYPAVLERQLAARGHPHRVVNAGVNGDTTSGGLARVESVLAYKPNIVILELGANDGLRGLPVESTRANLEQILEALQRAGVKVVLAGMTLPPNYGPDYIRSFEQIFVDLSKKYKVPRIPFLLEDVATRSDRMQRDGLHPTAGGHQVMAATVLRVLEPLLDGRPAGR